MTKLLLTPEETAELLALGRSKVYELLATGALSSVKIGRCRRVPVEALETFLATLRDGAA